MTIEPNLKKEMPKAYEPAIVEKKLYQFWLDKEYFKPVIDKNKKPFVIIMPPPNITGELHIGHTLPATMEDIMTRWHRMKGDPTLWLPGVDHAGIAAQIVVERMLAKEGLSRHDIGREKFLEQMWDWAKKCRHNIGHQHQRLGVSCDWSRETFTMDEGPCKAVRAAFVKLYENGLIYQGERIINWCPRCMTAISDLEVDHKDVAGGLWYVKYPFADNPDEFITVATTRPETILGDTAVAVNPASEKFKTQIGRKLVVPFVNREIPIVPDEAVDLEFGTGAVKVTPAHDPVDFEIGERHSLEIVTVIGDNAVMNENAGPYNGMDRFECRKAIIDDLDKAGLLVKTEEYSHSIGHCQRCGTIIEPLASKQWFVKTQPLAEKAIKAVTSGEITIIPERFNKVYLNWMENIRDWCISRQLWWGHRIPVWYCRDCGEIMVCMEDPDVCEKCGSSNIEQDSDVLDTWFSSGLWPHSTLGWPDDTEDLRYFYPTAVMETGYDILFFWVARMIMMGIADTGEIPFHTVYLHGLIRDEHGEKMSKMKGNVLNPLDVIDEYGTDALRFAISTGNTPGNDMKLSKSRLEAGRNFANKLWNATRFVLRSIQQAGVKTSIEYDRLPVEDRWIISKLNRMIQSVDGLLEEYQFGEAEKQVYEFLWGDFCDWYIELVKIRLRSEDKDTVSPVPVLIHVLDMSLRMLHPFMPFITEELWQNIMQILPEEARETESIMIVSFPVADASRYDADAEKLIDAVIEIIHAIRNTRGEYKVDSNKWIEAIVYAGDLTEALQQYGPYIENLGKARPIQFMNQKPSGQSAENTVSMVLKDTELVIPLGSMVDLEAERKRIQKELEIMEKEVARLETRLQDQAFLSKAPAPVVAKENARLLERKDKLARLAEQLNSL